MYRQMDEQIYIGMDICRRRGLSPWVRKIPGEGNGNFSVLAWEVPWTEEPGGLQSVGSQGQIQLSNQTNRMATKGLHADSCLQ